MEGDVKTNDENDVMENGEVVRLVLLCLCEESFIANQRDGINAHSRTLCDWFLTVGALVHNGFTTRFANALDFFFPQKFVLLTLWASGHVPLYYNIELALQEGGYAAGAVVTGSFSTCLAALQGINRKVKVGRLKRILPHEEGMICYNRAGRCWSCQHCAAGSKNSAEWPGEGYTEEEPHHEAIKVGTKITCPTLHTKAFKHDNSSVPRELCVVSDNDKEVLKVQNATVYGTSLAQDELTEFVVNKEILGDERPVLTVVRYQTPIVIAELDPEFKNLNTVCGRVCLALGAEPPMFPQNPKSVYRTPEMLKKYHELTRSGIKKPTRASPTKSKAQKRHLANQRKAQKKRF
jgi:hypothetical protein